MYLRGDHAVSPLLKLVWARAAPQLLALIFSLLPMQIGDCITMTLLYPIQADVLSLQKFQFVYSYETFLVSVQIAQTSKQASECIHDYYSITKQSRKC